MPARGGYSLEKHKNKSVISPLQNRLLIPDQNAIGDSSSLKQNWQVQIREESPQIRIHSFPLMNYERNF